MAAAPSKPSPTNRQVATEESSLADVEGNSVAPVTAAVDAPCSNEPSSSSLSSVPSYKSVENSTVFLLAKQHLNDGKFEEALSTLEEGIQSVQATLLEESSGNTDCSLHEAMAPFHYLYGTTLLYSIEESTDSQDMTLASAPTVEVNKEEGKITDPSPEEGKTPNNPSTEEPTKKPSPEEDGKTTPSAEEAPAPSAEVTDEMQIAWENFEAARSIIESMLVEEKYQQDEKLKLDLAQIFLREGDLQRMNGRYDASIQDYQSALSIRKLSTLIGPHDRKLADAHYNLALALMLQASDASNKETANEAPSSLSQAALRNKSVFHYLACSKCICGQIAQLRGVEPATILEAGKEDDTLAKAKTSPDDLEYELPHVASAVLTALRKKARQMLASAVENKDKIDDMCELLDEIQETIDEAETSAKGVQQVSEMKAAAAAAVAGETEDGSSTTIGFGPSSATAAAVATVATANDPIAPARPMMVIKKKRKAPSTSSQSEKRPKPEAE